MRNLQFRLAAVFFIFTMVSCRHGKVKVVWEEYSKAKPKTIYYFDNEEDARQDPAVFSKNGVNYASKPITFEKEHYYENGQLQSKGGFIKGQSCGLWQYFYETGIHQARCYYWNGVTRDSVYCWYPSGKLKRTLFEIDKLKHRWHGFDYYESGNKHFERYVVNDSLDNWTTDGNWNWWFDNGKPKFHATVKKDWTVGKWKSWDSLGNITESDTPINISF